MGLRDIAELVRLPAALSVPGDTLAGAAAAGWPFGPRTLGLAGASVCLYWAGMALNDYADRELDAVERPERPIPSGRVSPGTALGLAAGLTAAGVGLAGCGGGRRALAVALPLAGAVWAYDLVLKNTPAGPVAMAACRAFDVLMGAGTGRLRAAAPAALTVGLHTLTVTELSRYEVRGASPAVPRATLAATGGVGALAAWAAGVGAPDATRRGRLARHGSRTLAAGLLAVYAGSFGRAQLAAARDPGPGLVRRAVGAGILGLIPLQAALSAAAGSVRAAVPVAAAFPLARWLARRTSPT